MITTSTTTTIDNDNYDYNGTNNKDNYTPGIYAKGYIVFVFPFVRTYVRSFVLLSRSWNYVELLMYRSSDIGNSHYR